MLASYLYTAPMIILILFIEYKKRRFLHDAHKEDVDIRNVNQKSLNSKTYLYYLFVVFFAVVYKDIVVAIRENFNSEYIGRLISAILPIFIILSLIILRTNRDFFIKDNLINFPFKPSFEISKDYYFVLLISSPVHALLS